MDRQNVLVTARVTDGIEYTTLRRYRMDGCIGVFVDVEEVECPEGTIRARDRVLREYEDRHHVVLASPTRVIKVNGKYDTIRYEIFQEA